MHPFHLPPKAGEGRFGGLAQTLFPNVCDLPKARFKRRTLLVHRVGCMLASRPKMKTEIPHKRRHDYAYVHHIGTVDPARHREG